LIIPGFKLHRPKNHCRPFGNYSRNILQFNHQDSNFYCPTFERDQFNYFLIKIKPLRGLNMWSPGSKKTYVLNRSCMDLFTSPCKEKENPFCFSIPVTYFNFLDSDQGEKITQGDIIFFVFSFPPCSATIIELFTKFHVSGKSDSLELFQAGQLKFPSF